MSSTGPSSKDIQSHIYNSFLEGSTPDVALNVQGTWNAIYKLHRVVLIQAGFFRSLFDGGFAESRSTLKPSSHHREVIDIILEDSNITRAAFELCIARLYGGGPNLFIDPSIIPTPSKPLTPSFPIPTLHPNVPSDQQPATPRFLMSLLATSIYLSIPSITRQCLILILSSVGPYTAVPYLTFAIGDGIGPLKDGEMDAAVGLERIAELVRPEPKSYTAPSRNEKDTETKSVLQGLDSLSIRERDDDRFDLDSKKEDPSVFESQSSYTHEEHHHQLYLYYGAVSDKVGEAVACWLARWGADMFEYEQRAMNVAKDLPDPSTSSTRPTPKKRRSTVSSTPWSPTGMTSNAHPLPAHAPVIWRRGGLSARWVRAVLSSDALFVRGEIERYNLAKSVVELRRAEGIDEDEEAEFTKLFAEGIYYENMSLEDLVSIYEDVSSASGQPYVPAHIIQSAHWKQALLRTRITGRSTSPASPPSSPISSGTQRDKELGISISAVDILSKVQGPTSVLAKDQHYWPVPSDASMRIGDSSAIENATMDELFDRPGSSSGSKGAMQASTSEATFFGLKTNRCVASECSNVPGVGKWSPHPPFRFAVEFWDVESLREKSRLHSHTIWYAGSLFNVYVQLVRKKGIQLGVYLHRQSSVDPIPASSAPFGSHRPDRDRVHVRNLSTPTTTVQASASTPNVQQSVSTLSPLTPTRSTTPVSGSTMVSVAQNTLPVTAPPVAPPQPYRDPRPAVSAYFTVSCASATGSSLTMFTSSPDVFSVSQSWGWKSSSLRTEEYLEMSGKEAVPASTMPSEKVVSLRVTVVLGII